jgi:signal transduction histidine kinase
VLVRYGSDNLNIEVANSGSGASQLRAPGHGHGLVGMRERVAMFGGQLDAGPRPDGSFLVSARIPLAIQAT